MGKDRKPLKGKTTVKVKDLAAKSSTRVKGGQSKPSSSGADRPMEQISLN